LFIFSHLGEYIYFTLVPESLMHVYWVL